jgi:two-component system response regulator HydG/two-component system response regulator AtoC
LLAQGGTVFLDEIGELSPIAQAKLLRVLESREVFRLGARSTQALDARVIAATNQDLERLIEEKGFRPDLFFRLNVARVHLPPLRTRCEDIPALMAHYMGEMSRRTGTPIGPFAPETLECLMRYARRDESERARILSTLFATRWNKCRAADQLHWSRMTLYRKMTKYGIRGNSPR